MKRLYDNNRMVYIVMIITVVAILGSMVLFTALVNKRENVTGKTGGSEETYSYHIAMIHSDLADVFWRSVYEAARAEGEREGVYIENFGTNLNEDYTTAQLLEMAVASRVDGIILAGGGEQEIQLIEQAEEEQIPVITVQEDIAGSRRKSYVGANQYTLGEMYGNEVVSAVEGDSGSAVVLVPAEEEKNAPNFIFSAITDSMEKSRKKIRLSSVKTGASGDFESEETIKDILLDEGGRPDVLVCLSTVDTISAYQCVIDYNLVGKVQIIGYYTSPEILEGIQKGIIRSTIEIDAKEMGSTAVKAMKEYKQQEYINEYFPISAKLITSDNVEEYIEGSKDIEDESATR